MACELGIPVYKVVQIQRHALCMVKVHVFISLIVCVCVCTFICSPLLMNTGVCIMLCVTLKVKGASRSPAPAGKPISGATAVGQQVCVLVLHCVCVSEK